MNLDHKAREDFKINSGSVFAWILMSSWLYYQRPHSTPILSDPAFDNMCKYALDKYDDLEHPHAKPYITKEDLKAGSLYALGSYQYPYWCIQISERLSMELEEELKTNG